MALGSSTIRKKIYYLNPKSTRIVSGNKVTDPHFTVKMTDEQGKIKELKDETAVSGHLLSIGHGEYEYPKDSGKKVKTIHLYLHDENALYKIEGSVNTNMMRGLMNTVAGTKKFGVMEISLYEKDGFPNLFVRNDGEKCQWRYDYKTEIAPLITFAPDSQDETKQTKIYHSVNKLLWEAWLETEPVVKLHAEDTGLTLKANALGEVNDEKENEEIKASQERANAAYAKKPEPVHSIQTGSDEDDLPF
ncbi:MAG: hypothetical protein WKF87_06705 [Chryseolinea sp.]